MKKEQNIFNPGLAGAVVKFANFLKANGFRIFQSSIHDSLSSLKYINLFDKQDFFFVLRANLVKTDMEWAQFPRLFEEFWSIYIEKEKKKNSGRSNDMAFIEDISEDGDLKEEKTINTSYDTSFKEEKQYLEGIGYSPVSKVEKKELSLLNDSDVQVARLALKRMAEPFRIQRSRRSKRGLHSGDSLDFPKIMRRSLKFEGFPFELFFKEKKKRLRKLVIIADVSGSMERYAHFVIPFILSIRGAGSKAEVFVFSTSLTRVTHIVRHLDIEKALEKISQEVPNWSGGTRIGYSLHEFNQWEGGSLVNKRTVVIILSDGWDLGSKELLRKEMEILNRKAYSIIWLNPVLSDPNLQRLCQGMKVALPYVDHLLPVKNLEELKRVGKLISRLMIH